jgi:hypothetical protein
MIHVYKCTHACYSRKPWDWAKAREIWIHCEVSNESTTTLNLSKNTIDFIYYSVTTYIQRAPFHTHQLTRDEPQFHTIISIPNSCKLTYINKYGALDLSACSVRLRSSSCYYFINASIYLWQIGIVFCIQTSTAWFWERVLFLWDTASVIQNKFVAAAHEILPFRPFLSTESFWNRN